MAQDTLRLAILTPEPDDPYYHASWPREFEKLAAPLRAHDAAVEAVAWSDPRPLAGFDLVLPLMAWGYHEKPELWRTRLDAWEAAGVRLANPAAMLRWNGEKRYLLELAERGVAVVPTLRLDSPDGAALARAAASLGAGELVVKPEVAANGEGVTRLSAPYDARFEGSMLVQPFMADVAAGGELSLFFFDGRFSHAVVKRPGAGDFRVQERFGGGAAAAEATAEQVEAGARVIAALDEVPLYARADMVAGEDGRLRLMELELIEPSLFLAYAPQAGVAFAESVVRAARAAGGEGARRGRAWGGS